MKTADSIEQQEKARDKPDQSDSKPANTPPARKKSGRSTASYIAAWKWRPGQSGNPSGRPKHDLAAEIARAVFENNAEALYKAYTKAALKGNAYAFKELADRAFGKLKETHHLDVSPYKDLSTENLEQEIKRLEVQLGYRKAEEVLSEPKVLPPVSGDSRSKPN